MGRISRSAFPPGVTGLRDRIEGWRRQREKRSPMPEDLWTAAVTLARAHGVYAIARALRVNYGTLKGRVAAVPENGGNVRHPLSVGFVELDAGRLMGGSAPAETVVEFTGADGARLSVRLAGPGGLDVLGLAAAFWQRGR